MDQKRAILYKKKARSFYDGVTVSYFDEKSGIKDDIYPVKEIIERELTHEPLVLDIGCGKGGANNILKLKGYIGLDLSLNALQKHPIGSWRIQVDMETIPLQNNSVDMVISITALEHAPNPEKVLVEIDRVLKIGGICYLAPAWFCRPWASKGLTAKGYSKLELGEKIEKFLIPLRDHIVWQGLTIMPKRIIREAVFTLKRSPMDFMYQSLKPNLEEYLYTDSDAFSSMDPHSAILYFLSRGYSIYPSGFWNRLFYRHKPVVVRKVT